MVEAPQTVFVRVLAADVSSTSTSFGDATGLSFPIGANERWLVELFPVQQAAAAGTGLNLGFTQPAGCTTCVGWIGPISASAAGTRHLSAADTGTAQTGTPAGSTNTQNVLFATVLNGATPGTWQLRFASEVGGSAVTLKAGTAMRLTRLV